MSTIQTKLETSEIANSSGVEFLESFRTVDEDKDSDEESFHLFDADDDINKEINELKEDHDAKEENDGVIEPIEKSNLEKEVTENEEIKTNNETNTISSNPESENYDSMETSQNSNECPNLTSDCQSLKSPSQDIVSSENSNSKNEIDNSKSNEGLNSNERKFDKENDGAESQNKAENEDEILNKHELNDENLPDVDPNLEDTLLDENDAETTLVSQENCKTEGVSQITTHAHENVSNVTDSSITDISQVNHNDQSENDEKGTNIEEKSINIDEKENMDKQEKFDDSSDGSTEDLLDISVIKDSEQDAADIAEDARQLQKENEDPRNANQNDAKNFERMESETSEMSEEDGIREEYCEEQIPNIEAIKQTEENESEQVEEEEIEKKLDDVEISQEMAVRTEIDNVEKPTNGTTSKSKRTLSDDISDSSEAKKLKLANDEIENKPQNEMSFLRFMTKSNLKKFTRADLEEFCIQKLCETILHKSDLGELNHQLKQQELTINNLRKEQSNLLKRVKDLELVNKKLLQEVKNQANNGTKPLVPIKITRSVGLQVRSMGGQINSTIQRKSSGGVGASSGTPQKPQIQRSPMQVQRSNAVPNRSLVQTIPNRGAQLQRSPLKPQSNILSQVLQKRNSPNLKISKIASVANANAQNSPEKRKPPGSSVIDLTAEDDKKMKNFSTSPGGLIRSNKSVLSTTPAQVMYVVQQPNSQLKQGLFTTTSNNGQQKTVLLNFQPTATTNGVKSAVSVIPKASVLKNAVVKPSVQIQQHPAPLPNPPVSALVSVANKKLKAIPPKPVLSIRKTDTGIVLQWRMPYDLTHYEEIASYQLFAYQESASPPSSDMWRKVGDVKAMALPMACTLTQFNDNNKYYFAVRPVDIHTRIGKFSNPQEISL